MDKLYAEINTVGTSPYPATIPIKKIEFDYLYSVTNVRQVRTPYGDSIILELENKYSIFLPKRLSNYITQNPSILPELLKDALSGELRFVRHGHNHYTFDKKSKCSIKE